MNKKVSIILPIFNEAATVTELLNRVFYQPIPNLQKELVIIESNSTDGTRKLIQDFVESKRDNQITFIKTVFQDKPLGKGNAVREGFKVATGDIFLIQDGDLEYDVRDYPLLLEPILSGRASFVLGSRHLSAGSWKIRHFENRAAGAWLLNFGGVFFHGLFNVLYRQRLTDPTTMFKVFERKCLHELHFESNRFDFDFELLAKLIRAGFAPLEVPVSYSSRGFEEGKKIRIFHDPLTWIWAIFRFRFNDL